MADQYRCEHGHAYYDGDQGVGSPYDDGWHDAQGRHGRMDVISWDPWERNAYEGGYRDGDAHYNSMRGVVAPRKERGG